MQCTRPLSTFTSICFVLSIVGTVGVLPLATAADSSPPGGNDAALALRAAASNSTDRIIVKYRASTTDKATINAMARRASQLTGYEIAPISRTFSGAQILKLKQTLSLEKLGVIIRVIEGFAGIEYAEPDLRMMPLFTPNDPRYNEQWDYYEAVGGINLPAAWDTTQGENAVVAVVDTGYLPHQDLAPNLLLTGYDMISDADMANDGDGRDGDAFDEGDYSPQCGLYSSSWHGTHVAGTVAAVGDNGIGVTGVAFRAKVLPVRALGKCGGYLSDISDGIVWAAGGNVSGVPANSNPAQVISLSLGAVSSTCPLTFQSAIDQARQHGATVVVAAGNESRDSMWSTPANCDGVVAVAATTRTGGRAYFSNYGNLVDIAAPGEGILSTYNDGSIVPGDDSYASMSGTSMSTPHVSGVAALLYAVKPDITPDQVEYVLKSTARAFPSSCNGCGSGIVDAAAAVEKAPNVSDRSFDNATDYPIPNFRFIGATSSIDVPLSGVSGTIEVSVHIKHPSIQEVIVGLADPQGQIHMLKRYGGAAGADLDETYSLDMGQLPAAGQWQLRALDFGTGGDGYIDSWSITFP